MLKKLIVVVALCLSVSLSYASQPEEYQDGKYAVSVLNGKIDQNDESNAKAIYNILTTEVGGQSFRADLSKSYAINSMLRIPNQATYVAVVNDNGMISIVVFYFSAKLETKAISFANAENNFGNIKSFLSSPVATRAYQKAGFTLTKAQINSMVELK